MRAVEIAFLAGWVAFWLYWLVAALSAKRGRIAWGRVVGPRLVIVAVVIFVAHQRAFRHHGIDTGPWRAGFGLALFVLGLAWAIWARVHMGRNWGSPMTRKDEPELVTSGPYRWVRHPIYSGILAAGGGTAIGLDWRWLIIVVAVGAYFIYSARVEERILTEQFPDAYPRYRRRTKMIVPFVF